MKTSSGGGALGLAAAVALWGIAPASAAPDPTASTWGFCEVGGYQGEVQVRWISNIFRRDPKKSPEDYKVDVKARYLPREANDIAVPSIGCKFDETKEKVENQIEGIRDSIARSSRISGRQYEFYGWVLPWGESPPPATSGGKGDARGGSGLVVADAGSNAGSAQAGKEATNNPVASSNPSVSSTNAKANAQNKSAAPKVCKNVPVTGSNMGTPFMATRAEAEAKARSPSSIGACKLTDAKLKDISCRTSGGRWSCTSTWACPGTKQVCTGGPAPTGSKQ